MARLNILEWPAAALETVSTPVTCFDDKLKQTVADMHETMMAGQGCGLAANQVGVLQRIIVMYFEYNNPLPNGQPNPEVKKPWHNKPLTFINPELWAPEGRQRYLEGCLSFPGVYEYIGRCASVKVRALDVQGRAFEMDADEVFAVCLEHELDHLNGIPFTQRMSRLKYAQAMKKLEKRRSAAHTPD